jgi:group I intron endonuclease
MSKKYHYVYVTTNLLNRKKYIGDHSTDNLEKDKYLGSGRPYFEQAKIKYGKENFKKEILEFFDSKQEAFDAQEKYINEYNTLVPNGYNISPKGGHMYKGSMSESTKNKISEGNKGKIRSKEVKAQISKSLTGFQHTKETKEKMKIRQTGVISPMKGRKHTEETKEKMGIKNKGRKHTEEIKAQISKSRKGMLFSEATKEKMRKPKSFEHRAKLNELITCPYCGKEVKKVVFNRWHGNNCKMRFLNGEK